MRRLTQVATLHRCGPDGKNIRIISSNLEHDNTPWVLPDGRLLYQRWEYVDRSQVDYHHLWTTNPDGTGQRAVYGANSWFPNSLYFPQALPGESGRVLAILGILRQGGLGQQHGQFRLVQRGRLAHYRKFILR